MIGSVDGLAVAHDGSTTFLARGIWFGSGRTVTKPVGDPLVRGGLGSRYWADLVRRRGYVYYRISTYILKVFRPLCYSCWFTIFKFILWKMLTFIMDVFLAYIMHFVL